MLCPGISQNSKHHHLTLYKGQVWREKPYLELCDHNVLNIVDTLGSLQKNGDKLYVPLLPSWSFREDNTQIPLDSEILQSFTEMTKISSIGMKKYLYEDYDYEDVTNQIVVGRYECATYHHYQCVPPHNYYPQYIWTKEGLKKNK